jgi:MFS family permease
MKTTAVFKFKGFLREQSDMVWLCAAAFCMSCYHGLYIVATPFIIKALAGTDKDLGLASAMGAITYCAGCIMSVPILDNFNPKRVAQTGSGFVAVLSAVLFVIVRTSMAGRFSPDPIVAVIVMFGLLGFFTSMYWPPLMGWLSRGHEGRDLNRRQAFFNISWSIALVLSPFLSGILAEKSPVLPVLLGAVFAGGAFICVTLNPAPPKGLSHERQSSNLQAAIEPLSPLLPTFRWMARVALLTNFACVALMKTQLAFLFKDNLGFTESQFGTAMTIMCLTNFVGFFLAGRTHAWHYKLWPFLLAQIITGLSILAVVTGVKLAAFFTIAAFIGLSQAFMYASHLFYSASGSKKRLGSMAVHEMLLSAGHVLGYITGGLLAEYFDRTTTPYYFGGALVIAGLIAQSALWFKVPKRTNNTGA